MAVAEMGTCCNIISAGTRRLWPRDGDMCDIMLHVWIHVKYIDGDNCRN